MKRQPALTLTAEEKARWVHFVHQTWDAIAYDCIQAMGGECSREVAIEVTIDANRMTTFTAMTREEERVFLQLWHHARRGPELRRWLKTEVFTCGSYVL